MQNIVDHSKFTRVLYNDEARAKMFEGLEIAARAVGCTLGPRGKTVLIQQDNAAPIVTKDGVTVCKSVNLRDPILRMGAELVKQAASQTNEIAGDGTTTATVLTKAMVEEGLRLLRTGYSAKELCHGIELALSYIDEQLLKTASTLTTKTEIAHVGTISANGDTKIGELIADAMERVGRDGIITVEDAKGMATSLDVVEGMQVDRGYVSPYFVTNQDRMHALYTDAWVLLTDKKLSAMSELIPLLEKVLQTRKPLLIVADDIEGEALQGLVVNRVNGNLPVVAIKAPGYGQHKIELLQDMAIMTGAQLISASTGLSMSSIDTKHLGTLKKVVVDAKTTTMVGTGGAKEKEAVSQRIESLKAQLEDVTLSSDDIIKLKMRIAKLANGIAVIRVGGTTELEMIERKYRIEDALNATRAAADEGIVRGGGSALAAIAIGAKEKIFSEVPAEQYGARLMLSACSAPIKQIAMNAGGSPSVIMERFEMKLKQDDTTFGYNAATDKYENLLESGVIDPVKVTRTALKNAASVTMTFLTLDAVITEDEK